MPTYIALIDWTDQGVRGFKDSVDRYEAAQGQLGSMGVRFTDIYWTLGAHESSASSKRRTIKRSLPVYCPSLVRAIFGRRRCAPLTPTR